MYVCMYVSIYRYIYVSVCVCACACIDISIHTYIHTRRAVERVRQHPHLRVEEHEVRVAPREAADGEGGAHVDEIDDERRRLGPSHLRLVDRCPQAWPWDLRVVIYVSMNRYVYLYM